MNRRRFMLASAVAAVVPGRVLAQTSTSGDCAIGFVHGVLQFSPDCSTLDIPGLSISVAPPSHMIPAGDGSTSTINALQAERKERLQRKRAKKRRKQDRKAGKRDNRRSRRGTMRARRREQRARRKLPTEARSSGTGVGVSAGFDLAAGLYVASASVRVHEEPGRFTATLVGPEGFNSTLFDVELEPAEGSKHFSTTVTIPKGAFVWHVTAADSSWTLSLSKV